MNENGMNGYGASNGYHGTTAGGTWDGGKPSKPKHMNPNRTSLNEMKRRVAGIMEFVSRTQSELEGRDARTPPGSGGSAPSVRVGDTNGVADTRLLGGGGGATLGMSGGGSAATERHDLIQSVIDGLGSGDRDGEGAPPADPHEHLLDEKAFAGLSSAVMMSVLRTRLVGWQREYGVWGEK